VYAADMVTDVPLEPLAPLVFAKHLLAARYIPSLYLILYSYDF
jgi:hypothetical protein